MGIAEVLADAPNGHRIPARHIGGHGEAVGLEIFKQLHPRSLGEQGPGLCHREGLRKFNIHRFRVGPQHRHPHAGGREAQVGQSHDLAGFVEHLELLFAVAIGLQGRVVQKEVEGQGMGQHLAHRFSAFQNRAAEGAQFLHGPGAGTAGRLVGAHHHPLNRPLGRQGRQGQGEQDRGAVGVGNDAAVVKGCFGIHFRHHQGHRGIEPKGTGVVDHHGTRLGGDRGPLLRRRAASRSQHHIHAFKSRFADALDRELLVLPAQGLARRARRSQGNQLSHGELAFPKQGQQLLAHRTGDAENRHPQRPVGQGYGGGSWGGLGGGQGWVNGIETWGAGFRGTCSEPTWWNLGGSNQS